MLTNGQGSTGGVVREGVVTPRSVRAETEECREASGFAKHVEDDFPLFIWVLKNRWPPMTGSLGGHQIADICIVFLQIATMKINYVLKYVVKCFMYDISLTLERYLLLFPFSNEQASSEKASNLPKGIKLVNRVQIQTQCCWISAPMFLPSVLDTSFHHSALSWTTLLLQSPLVSPHNLLACLPFTNFL